MIKEKAGQVLFDDYTDMDDFVSAVRADRMRGGRNKFGPMYKRDRARKLQMMRQRQMAVQTLRGHALPDGGVPFAYPPSSHSHSHFTNLHSIKQEIQIPQVSSLTSSPDSSPSPITVASLLPSSQPSQQSALQVLGSPAMGQGEHKLWATANSSTPSPKPYHFDSGIGGGGGHNSGASQSGQSSCTKISPLIREFVSTLDDREWQNSLFTLLQNQTYNQCEVDLFELMCKVLDQNLFSQVDWARNSVFFKDLKVSLTFFFKRMGPEKGKWVSRDRDREGTMAIPGSFE